MLTSQQSPYLPLQRNFPSKDAHQLGVELDKAYIDIAGRVNDRTIGLFAVGQPTITGEKFFISGQPNRQQSLRRLFTFTSTAPIPHELVFSQIDGFTRLYGTYTDGTNWYGLIAGSNIAIPGQVSFYISPTNIVFLSGAGAPTVVSGRVIIEWLAFV